MGGEVARNALIENRDDKRIKTQLNLIDQEIWGNMFVFPKTHSNLMSDHKIT